MYIKWKIRVNLAIIVPSRSVFPYACVTQALLFAFGKLSSASRLHRSAEDVLRGMGRGAASCCCACVMHDTPEQLPHVSARNLVQVVCMSTKKIRTTLVSRTSKAPPTAGS